MTYSMPVGTSDPADFQLFEKGSALDGTGLEVDLVLYRNGVLVAGSPALTVEWLDQETGKVRVTGGEALEVGTYKFRFKLTNGSGAEGFVPNTGSSASWRVTRVQA